MFPEYVKFYYEKIPKVQKDIYIQMYRGFREHKQKFNIKADTNIISPEDLQYIFRCLYNDTPSFYFVDISKFEFIKSSTGYVFVNNFIYSEEEILKYNKAILDGLQIFKKRYIKSDMTDYEKELVIHDYLVRTVTYDYESINENEKEDQNREIYNVLGPLLRKKAVCWGIACAFKLICDYCRIKCFVILGKALPNNPGDSGHAWNIVRLDDENYHVDVTWDIKKKGDISFIYDYLNLNDHLIKLNHVWDDEIYPLCKALTYNYYYRNKLYVKDLEQIPDYIRRSILSGLKYITFKFVNRIPEETKIRDMIEVGMKKARYYNSYYWLVDVETHNIYIELC